MFFFFYYFAFVLACVVVVVLYIRVFFSSQWCKLEKQNRHNVCIFADFFMFSQGLLLKVYLQEGFTIKIAAYLYHSHILPCRFLALCTPRLPYPLDFYYN